LPGIIWSAVFARAGGLLGCGPSIQDPPARRAAIAAEALSGAKPADLPVGTDFASGSVQAA